MSTSLTTEQQRLADRSRLRRALNASLGFVLLLAACFAAQHGFDFRFLTVTPRSVEGLLGVLAAPLLHGSIEHIVANGIAVLMLGTLAGTVYPKATLRALPLLWIGSGLGAWLLGNAGLVLIWVAGLLTVMTGADYLVKAMPYLRDRNR